jgi:hypothetical protein
MEDFALSLIKFSRLENLNLNLNYNLLTKLPAFFINNNDNNKNIMNELILDLALNKIETIEEFIYSLNELKGLE